MTISDRLREERKKLGVGQEEFGKLAGVGLSSQKSYERGSAFPNAAYLEAVSDKVDVAYIVTGKRNGSEVAEEREVHRANEPGVVPFDAKTATFAAQVTDQLFEKFDIPEKSRSSLVPMVYSLLMGGQKTSEDIFTIFNDMPWDKRK